MSDMQHQHGEYDNDQSAYSHPDIHTHHSDAEGVTVRKKIWKVFWILAAITALEFVIAFAIGRSSFRNVTFIVMTLVKAGYIVGIFMHLKDEVRSLIMTIILPLVLAVWLIVALLVDGAFYNGGWLYFG